MCDLSVVPLCFAALHDKISSQSEFPTASFCGARQSQLATSRPCTTLYGFFIGLGGGNYGEGKSIREDAHPGAAERLGESTQPQQQGVSGKCRQSLCAAQPEEQDASAAA